MNKQVKPARPSSISEEEAAKRSAIGDLYRRSQEMAREEEAIRSLRYAINKLIELEKEHQKRLTDLNVRKGA